MKEIYSIYLTEKNVLVFKRTKYPNDVNVNESNSYNHKLILRKKIENNHTSRDINTWSDLYVRR